MNKPVIATKVARWIAKHPGKLPAKLGNLVKWTVEGHYPRKGSAGTRRMTDKPRLIEVAFPLKQASLAACMIGRIPSNEQPQSTSRIREALRSRNPRCSTAQSN